MFRFRYSIILLYFISGITSLSAYSQSVKADFEKDSIFVGEQVKLRLTFSFPSKAQSYQFPLFENNTITSSIEIIRFEKTDTLSKSESLTELQKTYIITSFDSGAHVLPPLPFSYTESGSADPAVLLSDSILLNVNLVQVDTTKAIMDIKNPWGIPFRWREYLPYFIAALIILILFGAGLYYYMRRKRGLPLFPSRTVPLLPPDEEALAALDRMKKEKIWRSGQIKTYYTSLTDIVRRYVERRFQIPAPELTSDETIQALSETETSEESITQLSHIFSVADMVKFAKSNPDPTEHEYCLDMAFEFVHGTKPVQPEQEFSESVSKDNQKSESEV